MKKILAITFILVLVLLSSLAYAKVQHKNLHLNRITIIEDVPSVSVTVENDLREFGSPLDFNNGKIVASIPELGIRSSKSFDLEHGDRDTKRVFLDIPAGIPKGEYYVRIVVTNEDVTRIKHRLITIE